jgi:hypothetical protein
MMPTAKEFSRDWARLNPNLMANGLQWRSGAVP